jgi:hypothetical protein
VAANVADRRHNPLRLLCRYGRLGRPAYQPH